MIIYVSKKPFELLETFFKSFLLWSWSWGLPLGIYALWSNKPELGWSFITIFSLCFWIPYWLMTQIEKRYWFKWKDSQNLSNGNRK